MNWLNLELKTLRSTEYLGADPVQRATWINLLSFCADHENGGVIEGSVEWNDRKWMQLTGVTLEEALSECDLWEWKDGGVSVKHYPIAQEQKVKRNRRNGKKGGRPSADKADGYPDGQPHGSADGSVSLKRNSNSNRKGIVKKEVVVATAPESSGESETKPKQSKAKATAPSQLKENVCSDFERCWELYRRRGNKQQSLRYWNKLSAEDKQAIERAIPAYIKSNDLQFLKHFQGWINPANRMWEDTIVSKDAPTTQVWGKDVVPDFV